jgi:hypothetical protein
MKLTTVIAILCLSSAAFAQQSVTSVANTASEISSGVARGVRVALLKPSLEAKIEASFQGFSASDEDRIDNTTGISVGYAQIPTNNLGFIADLAYLELKDGGKAKMMRASGNATYGINNMTYVKGGLNVSNLDAEGEKFDAGIGFQAGVGLQVNRNIGFELNYTRMNQESSQNISGLGSIDVDIQESGLELALTGTF